MTFLNCKGQSLIESVIALSLILSAFVALTIMSLFGLAKLLLVRWAALHCLCIAESPHLPCELLTRQKLKTYFAFQHVLVLSKTSKGVIATRITTHLGGLKVSGEFHLYPFEYKRVSHEKKKWPSFN